MISRPGAGNCIRRVDNTAERFGQGCQRRIQIAASRAYSEIRDNLIDASMRPIDILRFKLAFFGAMRFDPRSDRWVRITLFQGSPFPDELDSGDWDLWPFAA